ncbi:uncharacterized protein FIBRA_02686 [Fibroporia radiculosa]|uniref:Nas2 N-terminal domain-containing protein n=1 Tax=Fibroporia radiculosa TaxID=599839 RepID=J4G2B6_9APHY|nr:uncharacterized protein FIBRA_02686 [Fibroporia radiculosa]CCM00648.1 predicted protein [Fibroporia radiculosa]
MGMMLPSQDTPAEQVRALMIRKENIEAELDAQASILKANGSTLSSSLLDAEGFPRSDIDVWAVRHARVRIIELRNDLSAVRDKILTGLQGVYDPGDAGAPGHSGESTVHDASPSAASASSAAEVSLQPFAKVNGVAPGSPAAAAGLLREDLVLSFGPLTHSSFSSTLQPLVEYVAGHENTFHAWGYTFKRRGYQDILLLFLELLRQLCTVCYAANTPAFSRQGVDGEVAVY